MSEYKISSFPVPWREVHRKNEGIIMKKKKKKKSSIWGFYSIFGWIQTAKHTWWNNMHAWITMFKNGQMWKLLSVLQEIAKI